MSEILTPLTPIEAIDRLINLKLRVAEADDAELRAILVHQLDVMQRTVDRVLPADDAQLALREQLLEAHKDLHSLVSDMHAFEARSDFGPAFIALTQSYLATLTHRDQIKAQINIQLRDVLAETWVPGIQ